MSPVAREENPVSVDSFGALDRLEVGGESYEYFRLDRVEGLQDAIARLPYSLKILLENLLRT